MKDSNPTLFVSLLAAGLVTACNAFSPVDHPGGDVQLISAARACLDRGDSSCALSNYQKLSADKADIAASESAFTILDQQGAGMVAFSDFIATAVGSSSDVGKALTRYAEKLSSGAGESKRTAIFQAYKQRDQISANNPQLKAFVEFTAGLALAAEMLAEASQGDGILHKNNLVANATACPNSGGGVACLTNTSCAMPASSNLTDTASTDYDTYSHVSNTGSVTGTVAGTTATTDQLYFTIKHALDGLSGLGASSSFSDIFTKLGAGVQPSTGGPASQQCFRATLIEQQLGE